MSAERITLVVEGLDRDKGDVRLEVFVEELRVLLAALARADRNASGGKKERYFAVVGLSHNSPATVEVEARYQNPHLGTIHDQAFDHLFGLAEAVERGSIPEDVDYGLLQDLRALAAPIGTKLRAATLKVDSRIFSLSESMATRIDAHLADQEQCFSSIEGMMEKINVHDEANAFTIYPDVGPARVTCHFEPTLSDKAISAIGRRVLVSGLCTYRKFANFPHHVAVSEIEIYGSEDQLPTFDDVRGLAPELTSGVSSEELIRGVRDAWQ